MGSETCLLVRLKTTFTNSFYSSGSLGPCVDIAQPDIAASGGLSEFMKIATLGDD